MALNFSDIANKKLADIEKPPLPPTGLYRWSITKLPEISTSQNGEWDILTVSCRALEAVEADMDDYKGEVTNISQTLRFMFNKNDEAEFEKSLFRARQFFEKHVQCADENDSMAQAMNNSINGQFLGQISWSPDKNDPENFFANLGKTAPLD